VEEIGKKEDLRGLRFEGILGFKGRFLRIDGF
jgi:hypothetical protein